MAISIALVPLMDEDAWVACNIMLLYIGIYLSMIPHELGHLLGALLTRQEILQMTLGSGRCLYSKKAGGIYFEIRAWPTEGLLFRKYKNRAFIRLRDFITVLAGPLANISLALLIWLVFSEQLEHANPSNEPTPALALLLANLVVGLGNLWPFTFRSHFGEMQSDGKQLLLIPFMPQSHLEEKLKQQAIAAAFLALNNNDFLACEQLCAEGLAAYPRDSNLMLIKSTLLCNRGEYRAARELIIAALKDDAIQGVERALAENNIAWCNYVLDEPGLLEEAERLSVSAMQVLPWSLAVRSTRGAILIAKGDIKAGIELLNDKRFVIENNTSQALAACTLCLGYSLQGDKVKAQETLKRAAILDPDCVLLERARKTVGSNS
ncbi:MAG TPA: site-2 protease family protein [Gammaproteobacteria bacterium]